MSTVEELGQEIAELAVHLDAAAPHPRESGPVPDEEDVLERLLIGPSAVLDTSIYVSALLAFDVLGVIWRNWRPFTSG
jgi:hypothetical protein